MWYVAPCMLLGTVVTVIGSQIGQSVQQLCCGLDSQYSDCYGLDSHYGDCYGLDSLYSDCVVGWTVIIVMLLWDGQSL